MGETRINTSNSQIMNVNRNLEAKRYMNEASQSCFLCPVGHPLHIVISIVTLGGLIKSPLQLHDTEWG